MSSRWRPVSAARRPRTLLAMPSAACRCSLAESAFALSACCCSDNVRAGGSCSSASTSKRGSSTRWAPPSSCSQRRQQRAMAIELRLGAQTLGGAAAVLAIRRSLPGCHRG